MPRTTSFRMDRSCGRLHIAFIQLSAAPSRTALPGSVPSWAKAANHSGAANADDTVVFRASSLPWRQGRRTRRRLPISVSTPGHANAGQFLTPTQFRNQFSPTSQDMSAVTSWPEAAGVCDRLRRREPSLSKPPVPVAQAGVGVLDDLQHLQLRRRAAAIARQDAHGPVIASGRPRRLSVLDEGATHSCVPHPRTRRRPDAFVNAKPCSACWGEKTVDEHADRLTASVLPAAPSAFAPCGYAGAQLQGVTAWPARLPAGPTARGVTVAVIDAYASPTIVQDIETYSSLHGLPASARTLPPGRLRQARSGVPQNKAQDPQGWSGEETLDIEAVHTMAPGASIVYVGAPNNYADLDSALNHVVDRHLAAASSPIRTAFRPRRFRPAISAVQRHDDPGRGGRDQRAVLLRRLG